MIVIYISGSMYMVMYSATLGYLSFDAVCLMMIHTKAQAPNVKDILL